MPRVITAEFKTTKIYFDLRPGGGGEKPEGFWAMPIFNSENQRARDEAVRSGRGDAIWQDLLAKKVVDWEGFNDMNGEGIPCTPENIIKLCESDPMYMLHMYGKITDAGRAGVLITEKN